MYIKFKKQIVKICHYMHAQGFIAGSDGNVSIKVNKNRVLITPSGLNKGFISEHDILTINLNGKIIDGTRKASSETLMHLKVYELRHEINAVIHAHPPYVGAFNVANIELSEKILPETVLLMKKIITTEYSRPCSNENSKIVEKHISDTDTLILKRHGSLTVGTDLMSAYNKLEKLEHTAKLAFIANSLGGINLLHEKEVKELLKIRKELNIK